MNIKDTIKNFVGGVGEAARSKKIEAAIEKARNDLANAEEAVLVAQRDHAKALADEAEAIGSATAVAAAALVLENAEKLVKTKQDAIKSLTSRLREVTIVEAQAKHDAEVAKAEAAFGRRLDAVKEFSSAAENMVSAWLKIGIETRAAQVACSTSLPIWSLLTGPTLQRAAASELFRLCEPVAAKLAAENGNATPVNFANMLPPGAAHDNSLQGPSDIEPLVKRFERLSRDAINELKGIKPAPAPIAVTPTIAPAAINEPLPKGRTMSLAEATAKMTPPKRVVTVDYSGRGRA